MPVNQPTRPDIGKVANALKRAAELSPRLRRAVGNKHVATVQSEQPGANVTPSVRDRQTRRLLLMLSLGVNHPDHRSTNRKETSV